MYDNENPGPGNLYHATRPNTSYAPLRNHTETEVVIVGGGLTGLSTALHLAENGVDCTLLEARQPGWGASGRNGGQLNPGLKYDPDVILQKFGHARGARLVDMAWGSSEFTLSLIRRLGIDCDARQNGTLRAVSQQNMVEGLKHTVETWQRFGMEVQFLDEQAVAQRTGTSRYRAALLDPRGGDVNPLKLSQGLAAAAAAAGSTIHGDSKVLSMTRKSGHWHVATAQGSVTARRVLLASNGYTDKLCRGLARTVFPVFSAIAATAPLPAEIATRIMPTRSVLYEAGAITVYYRVDAQNRLLIGGRGPMTAIDRASRVPNLTDYAAGLWPTLKGVAWEYAWNGRIAMTRDHLPHFHNPQEGLFACLGYNGRGVALSTALGPHLADVLQGGRVENFPLPVTDISPVALHAFWPLGAKATIWHHRIRQRLGW